MFGKEWDGNFSPPRGQCFLELLYLFGSWVGLDTIHRAEVGGTHGYEGQLLVSAQRRRNIVGEREKLCKEFCRVFD